MALLSSGCRETVEGLPNVQSFSTTQQWQSYRAGWRAVSAEFKAFHFRSIKSYSAIPLFRIPRFTASRGGEGGGGGGGVGVCMRESKADVNFLGTLLLDIRLHHRCHISGSRYWPPVN